MPLLYAGLAINRLRCAIDIKYPGILHVFEQGPQSCHSVYKNHTQPVKIGLNKELNSKQKTIQIFNIDAQGYRKPKNKNPPMREIGVAS